MGAHVKNGVTQRQRNYITAEEAAHPDYAACDNAMRGRVEQYELRTNPPSIFVAYVGKPKRNGMGCDRIAGQTWELTTWTGDELGSATLGASWRGSGVFGSRMYQIYAWMSGREYTGRGFGAGCSVVLRETAASKRKRAAASPVDTTKV